MNKRLVRRYINKINKIEEEIFYLKSKQREIMKILNHHKLDVIGKSYGLPYPTYFIYSVENDELLNHFWGE